MRTGVLNRTIVCVFLGLGSGACDGLMDPAEARPESFVYSMREGPDALDASIAQIEEALRTPGARLTFGGAGDAGQLTPGVALAELHAARSRFQVRSPGGWWAWRILSRGVPEPAAWGDVVDLHLPACSGRA